MATKVYFNSNCSKCRTAVKFLEDANIDYFNYEYLNEGLIREDILEILKKGDLNVNQILRTGDIDYKANIRGQDLSDDEKIDILVRYPKILQRPIVVTEKKAVVAKDKDSLDKLL
ncbi:MAG: arsenate reductase [Nanoarchaeota archaeon]|jgi:arsenate reductase|nr:arsenate reductase [Nanoarchaeota archaeon]